MTHSTYTLADVAEARARATAKTIAEVGGCDDLVLSIPLHEHERIGVKDDATTWPPRVMKLFADMRKGWEDRNPRRLVRVVASAIEDHVAVMVIHHAAADEVSVASVASPSTRVPPSDLAPAVSQPPASSCGCGD